MTSGVEYFTQKLPPEIRVRIYTLIFAATPCARIMEKFDARTAEIRDSTAILRTCKLVYSEAVQVFYNIKCLRLTCEDLAAKVECSDFCQLVRSVQIIDLATTPSLIVRSALLRLAKAPRARELKILSDDFVRVSQGSGPCCTARMVAEREYLGGIICTDIGRFAFLDERLRKIEIVHTKLLKLWPSVKTTPTTFDPIDEIQQKLAPLQLEDDYRNAKTKELHRSLRLWVGLWQAARDYQSSSIGTLLDWRRHCVLETFFLTMSYRNMNWSYGDLDILVRDMGPRDNPLILE